MTSLPTSDRYPRITITEIRPHLAHGRYAPKRITGDALDASAVILKEGHDLLAAELRYRPLGAGAWLTAPMRYSFPEDVWYASGELTAPGAWEFRIRAWTDRYATWVDELQRKISAGRDVSPEILEGVALIRETATRAPSDAGGTLSHAASRMEAATAPGEALVIAEEAALASAMAAWQERDDLTDSEPLPLSVDRERARFGAWYELFVRSQGRDPATPGTFADAEARLPEIQAMGFDVVYLAPIHPIGTVNRKGPNNALSAGPGDPGSPWAIGNAHGGHDAISPELGTIDDFDRFVAAAAALGIEVALDFAIQCAPDHPYVKDHPEWFRRRPDGTVKYAENPPKRYEDIVALDMWCDDWRNLWAELRRVVLHWVEHGVRIFRVDNPHTKPIPFWEWLIASVRQAHPDVLFLAEAFTRPRRMQELAKIGFSQSYTYFTWRNTRAELEEFLTELTRTTQAEFLRPNFFVNTPDILHEYLQTGGAPAFKIRAVLASTLSPTWGIYSGYELIENTPLHPGSEEYLDSEKYQVRVRDWQSPGNINSYVARLNAARHQHRALHLYTNLAFHNATDPAIISYSKVTPDGAGRILCIVNVDPFATHEAIVNLDGAALGLSPLSVYEVRDLLTGAAYEWRGLTNFVRLDPSEPAHLFQVTVE